MSLFEPEGPDQGPVVDPRRRDRRMLSWIVGVFVVVVGSLYVAGVAFASDRLPRETTIAGVEVGGLKPQAAVRRLREELAPRLGQPVEVQVGERTFSLLPDEAGLRVDVAASVAQVPVGRTWRPAEMWESLVGGVDRDAVVDSDEEALRAALDRIAAKVDQPGVEAEIRFTRTGPVATYPETGERLDVDAAMETVAAAYLTDGGARLTLVDDRPELDSEAVSDAMKKVANPAMSSPVTLLVADEAVTLRPRDYAAALSMVPVEGQLKLRVDPKRLLKVFSASATTLSTRPRDATVRIVDGRPTIIGARKGVTVKPQTLRKVFRGLVLRPTGKRSGEIDTVVATPEVSAADIRALGITEQVSEFTTYYPHADYRNVNIGRAAELVDGTILEPGETFSLNKAVGERTRANGFTEGFIISDGVFKEDLGGGVSQMATTAFNAAFFAGLEDVEHKPHSFYISRYPVGREATVAWPSVDLRFRNDTDHGVLIQAVHTPSTPSSSGSLTVRMWSTKVWDISSLASDRYAYTEPDTRRLSGPDCVPNEGYAGFSIDVTRVFRKAGEAKVARREVMHTVYTPSDTVICE